MKNLLIVLALITFCTACNNRKKEVLICNILGNADSLTKPPNYKILRASKEKLAGAWTNGTSNDTTFAIKENTMYSKDSYSNLRYELKNDSIKIDYGACTYKAKIYFYKDTLITESENGIAKFWRLTN